MLTNTSKVCTKCKQNKSLDLFTTETRNKDGKSYYCIDCMREIQRQWYQNNIEKIRIKEAEKRKNPEYIEYHKKWRHENKKKEKAYARKPKARFSSAKANAKYRNLPWLIEFQDYEKLLLQSCFYCGGLLNELGSGLDRLDNNANIGYRIDNVVPCCWICNEMKHEATSDEFKIHLLKIVKHLGLL